LDLSKGNGVTHEGVDRNGFPTSFSILRCPVSEPHSGAALSIDGAQVNVKQHGSNAHHENTGNDGDHFRSSRTLAASQANLSHC
jgi:hypothetical protein